MKNQLFIFSVIILLSACAGKENDKKVELEKLKTEQAVIKEKIKKRKSIRRIPEQGAYVTTSKDVRFKASLRAS